MSSLVQPDHPATVYRTPESGTRVLTVETPHRPACAPTTAVAPPSAVSARAVILSGGLGGGHDALAAACAAALAPLGVASLTVDSMALLGAVRGRVGRWAFRRAVATPAYDLVHFSLLRTAHPATDWGDRRASARLEAALAGLLGDERIELAIPVFATGVRAACRLKEAGKFEKVVTFVPDALAHALWVDEAVDLFLVTSAAGAASVRRYRPDAPVRVVDVPLDASFTRPVERDAARRERGVPACARCVLVTAGAWGLAPVAEIAAAIAADGTRVLAVAGRDRRLLARLRELSRRLPTVQPVGWTDRMAVLMAASDAVVTTPGMTTHEARAVGRPLILLDVIPGHGRENLQYELARGDAAVTGPIPTDVAAAVRAVRGEERQVPRLPNRGGEQFAEVLAELGIPRH